MDSFLTWGNLSAVFIAISGWSYMKAIYTKQVDRPATATWGIWAVLGLLILIAYAETGADETLPAAIVGFINPTIIFVLSIRYGKRGWGPIEKWCVAMSTATVFAWKTSGIAIIGLFGGLFADMIGAGPQIVKSWRNPDDEPWFPWTCFAVGSAINLFSVKMWEWSWDSVSEFSFPVYMTTGGFLIALPVVFYHTKVYLSR